MSDLTLFEIEEPEWVVLGIWNRCGLCGTKCSASQGGGSVGAVCNDCARLDGCRIRPHNPVVERREGQYSFTREQVANCPECGWWLDAEHRNDDGKLVPFTPDEVIDLVAEHAAPRHTSRWGVTHEMGEHDGLVAAQAKRRARYLASVAVAS